MYRRLLLIVICNLLLVFLCINVDNSLAVETKETNKNKKNIVSCWEKFWWYKFGKEYTYQQAVIQAKKMNEENPKWYEYLPSCPLKRPISDTNWELEEDKNIVNCFHPQATACYRSSRSYDSVRGKDHGQQCCYDLEGNLIRSGPGAGTPDFKSTSLSNTIFMRHLDLDVMPFIAMVKELGYERGAAESAKYWPPNQGEIYMWKGSVTDTKWDVKSNELISFEARGQVRWGEFGSSCDPDGSPNKAELIYVKPPLPSAKTGALIGVVVSYNSASEPFLIGKNKVIRMPASGRLFLGINDAIIANNAGYFLVNVRRVLSP